MSCGIYKFENLINHMVYIGQTINLEERFKKHQYNIKDKNHQEDIYKAFREFGFDNFSYEILEAFDKFDQENLNKLENYYIQKYNSMKPNGYNMIPGGSNGAGLSRGKPVEYYDIKGNYIKTFNSAHQAEIETGINYSSICACCREEIKHTKEFQWKYVNSNKKIKDLSTEKIIIKQKKICQYNLNGDLLQVYNSLKEAANETQINKSIICNVCNYKGKTAGGYIWRYYGDDFVNKNKKTKSKKSVEQYDKNLVLLNVFDSITEAAEKTNTNLANISSVCKGRRKTANGYIWKFKNNK